MKAKEKARIKEIIDFLEEKRKQYFACPHGIALQWTGISNCLLCLSVMYEALEGQ